MNPAEAAFEALLLRDRRFKYEAYRFVKESLAYALHEMESEFLPDAEGEESRHLTGQQLCEACRQYALEQYGYLAGLVLADWGIRSTSDLGDVVYNMIDIELMRKSETDRREDFDDVYSFEDAFEPRFQLLAPEEA